MNKCNITGETDGLYSFYIYGDFGEKAQYFVNDRFEFNLCESEFIEFMKKGRDIVVNLVRDDYTKQYDKWFTSQEIYELIQKFKYVPKGYYSGSWFQLNEEEEQWQWENKGIDVIEFVEYERIADIAIAYDDEVLAEVVSRRFPDISNPYKKENKVELSYLEHLQSLSKEELIEILMNNTIGFQKIVK